MTPLLPNFSGLLVTKGAAYWGLFPSGFVNSRVMRFTYAYEVGEPFDAKVHDATKVRPIYIAFVRCVLVMSTV